MGLVLLTDVIIFVSGFFMYVQKAKNVQTRAEANTNYSTGQFCVVQTHSDIRLTS